MNLLNNTPNQHTLHICIINCGYSFLFAMDNLLMDKNCTISCKDRIVGDFMKLKNLKIDLVWFDSMGAKSSCIFIETPDIRILVDPGASGMQPSYPLPDLLKRYYNLKAHKEIEKAGRKADITIITHYHYDHHTLPSSKMLDADALYRKKKLFVKNPNMYINSSQWERARFFFNEILEKYGKSELDKNLVDQENASFPDPMEELPLASKKDYGDYNARKKELIEKGRKWFRKLCDMWISNPWVPEIKLQNVEVKFADGKTFKFNDTTIRFTNPLFHGVEFDRVGWVIAFTVEYGGEKVLFSSDLQGPEIEDYAAWIIDENPDFLVLDGPPTYLFGYMLNRINLNRAVENLCWILSEVKTDVVIYDHHLLRDAKYRERVNKVYKVAERENKQVLTAAEFLGNEPMIFKAIRWKEDEKVLEKYMENARKEMETKFRNSP